MLCIQNNSTDPYFNLAAEEFVLKNFKEDCFMLWRNRPSIIVGKHQNTLAEINIDYVRKEKIDVVRRLSGGGTVFHDLGNLNFTFIQNAKDEKNLVDFKKYTMPIVEVLQQMGVDAKFEGRNDIMVSGKKISGNAEHVFKNRVLHHGTLLFLSNLSDLSKALKVNPLKYQDKGVKSVRSRVTNIGEHLLQKITVDEFKNTILNYIINTNENAELYDYSKEDIIGINKLVEDKYSTWEWNFAYSPKYYFEKSAQTKKGSVEVQINVVKGIIESVKISGDFLREIDKQEIEDKLAGTRHQPDTIYKTLQEVLSDEKYNNDFLDDLVKAMF